MWIFLTILRAMGSQFIKEMGGDVLKKFMQGGLKSVLKHQVDNVMGENFMDTVQHSLNLKDWAPLKDWAHQELEWRVKHSLFNQVPIYRQYVMGKKWTKFFRNYKLAKESGRTVKTTFQVSGWQTLNPHFRFFNEIQKYKKNNKFSSTAKGNLQFSFWSEGNYAVKPTKATKPFKTKLKVDKIKVPKQPDTNKKKPRRTTFYWNERTNAVSMSDARFQGKGLVYDDSYINSLKASMMSYPDNADLDLQLLSHHFTSKDHFLFSEMNRNQKYFESVADKGFESLESSINEEERMLSEIMLKLIRKFPLTPNEKLMLKRMSQRAGKDLNQTLNISGSGQVINLFWSDEQIDTFIEDIRYNQTNRDKDISSKAAKTQKKFTRSSWIEWMFFAPTHRGSNLGRMLVKISNKFKSRQNPDLIYYFGPEMGTPFITKQTFLKVIRSVKAGTRFWEFYFHRAKNMRNTFTMMNRT